jgi:hypothetical protein
MPAMPGLDFRGANSPEEQQKRRAEYEQKQREFWNSGLGRALDRAQRSYVLLFDSNGVFRVPDVPPGDYQLQISPTDPDREEYSYQQIGSLYQQVTIPAAPADKPNEPFDLGTLSMSIRAKARPGGRAPALEAKTFDGKTIKLEDFRGKYVLLDFWATWAGGTRKQELTTLKNLYASPGASNRLVIISLNLDQQRELGENFLKANPSPWLQCRLDDADGNVLPGFGLEGLPANLLIDPLGRIQNRNMRGASLLSIVRRALAQPVGQGN